MTPFEGSMLTPSALWLIIAGIAVSEVRKYLRDRRLDREARERRDRAAGVLGGEGAAAFLASLRERAGRP